MTATSTHTSASASPTSQDRVGIGAGATVYYGAVAVAILALVGITFGSRLVYIRRARRQRSEDRVELARRGEEGGLPTYRETTTPYTLSYATSPLGILQPTMSRVSRPVPASHPAYAPPAPIAVVPGSSAAGGEVQRATPESIPPPDYDGPPKYEG